MDIKIIFKNIKNRLETILGSQTDFCSTKHQKRFSKIIFKNYFFRTVLKTITKQKLNFLLN